MSDFILFHALLLLSMPCYSSRLVRSQITSVKHSFTARRRDYTNGAKKSALPSRRPHLSRFVWTTKGNLLPSNHPVFSGATNRPPKLLDCAFHHGPAASCPFPPVSR